MGFYALQLLANRRSASLGASFSIETHRKESLTKYLPPAQVITRYRCVIIWLMWLWEEDLWLFTGVCEENNRQREGLIEC